MLRTRLRDLIKPERIEVGGTPSDNRYGKFVAEPLERGFGTTIGNSLRRVLLSSLQGAAITSIKIEDVMHEFATISGVVEDVTEIVLNFKEVVLTIEEKEQANLRLEAEGPCEVTAGMIQGDGAVVIVNPDAHICTLAEGVKFNVDITVGAGRGYVPADKNKVEDAPIGTIFLDAIYSPVRRVNLIVTNARVGQTTDYDKLTMEIWTDGSIDPRTAVAQAALILRDQLDSFVGENLVEDVKEEIVEDEEAPINDNLFRRIDELDLSVRSANCLENADIKFVGELVQRTEAEMLRTKNFGRKSLNEIKEILRKMALSLGMVLENFPNREELEKRAREAVVESAM